MTTAARNSYDDVPYRSHPFPQTHPDRLAAVATLFGLSPPPPERCRVLELGCAAGGNLIPLAVALPDSTFLGVDLSGRQIEEGRNVIQSLALGNVELRHASIMDVGPADGQFDYIICHGVYSWVPAEVQDGILDVCARRLAPNGVAYVSYNTYPGWHMRGMIRDMMCYRARRFTDPPTLIGQARALLDFLAQVVPQENNPYALLLKGELEKLRTCSDAYLFHEHLEEHNAPIYFHQFVERAQARGLKYLGEADFSVMVPGNFPAAVQQVLQQLSADAIEIEQYMDFIRNRTFRQTLLCLPAQTPTLHVDAAIVTRLHIASSARPSTAQAEIRTAKPEQFKTADGVQLTSSEPLVKAAMMCLAEAWPAAVPFAELRGRSHALLSDSPVCTAAVVAQETSLLAERLLHVYASVSRLIELHVSPPRFARDAGNQPRASSLARLQAARGTAVTNLRHETIVLDELDRQLLALLDGSRDRAALLQEVVELASRGTLVVEHDGQRIADKALLERLLQASLDAQLQGLVRRALLVQQSEASL